MKVKAQLSNKYLKDFNMKKCVNIVNDFFDEYNFINAMIESNIFLLKNDNPEIKIRNYTNSSELAIITKKEELLSYMESINKKINELKESLTDEELQIFEYSIKLRMFDSEIQDIMLKSNNTYYMIKKSCYIKVILKFNLISSLNELLENKKGINL